MMGRVILLPSPMIITTPLMVVSNPQLMLRDMIWKDIDQDGIQDDGEEELRCKYYPSKSSNEELGTDTTDRGVSYESWNLNCGD